MVIGVISDTHGLLRPQAVEALAGSELILHAGDVGDARILDDLARIAPVKAIRGNVDVQPWARRLPAYRTEVADGVRIYMVHDVSQIDRKAADSPDVVIFGHSHKPEIRREGSVLYLNPGSAGRRRFRLPVSLAILRTGGPLPEAEIVLLEGG